MAVVLRVDFARRHGDRERLSSITTCTSCIDERKMPIVVSMGSMAASGGYYVSMAVGDAENTIYAEPTTITGSIGVIIPHYDLSGCWRGRNVKDDSIATGPLKQMGSFTKPMTEEDRQALEAILNDRFAGFKEVVTSGRPKFKDDPKALDAVATGQIFTAKQALDAGWSTRSAFWKRRSNGRPSWRMCRRTTCGACSMCRRGRLWANCSGRKRAQAAAAWILARPGDAARSGGPAGLLSCGRCGRR